MLRRGIGRPCKIFGLKHINSSIWEKIEIENTLHTSEFSLILPGSSALVDRVSSQLKILWSLYTNNEQVEPEVKLQGPLTLAPKRKK